VDELGHATIWYGLLADITGDNPDRLAFFRKAAEFRNVQFVELPKGDWAFTIVRQFLFDVAEHVRLEALTGSKFEPLAAAAAKMRNEELYHFRHSHAWLQRLGLGTEESHRRMQNTLDEIWLYISQLFEPLPAEALLVEASYVTEPSKLCTQWDTLVIPNLQQADLIVP